MSPLPLLLVALAQAPGALEFDVNAVYGHGARPALGGLLTGGARWSLYEARAVRGELEVGLLAGYQHESYALTASVLVPEALSGGNHRVELFLTGGHTLALFESRRLELGLHPFVGLTHVAMRGSVRSDAQGFTRSYSADATEFTFGLMARLAFKLTPSVGIVARFIAPIPLGGLGVSSYFMASLGVAWSVPVGSAKRGR